MRTYKGRVTYNPPGRRVAVIIAPRIMSPTGRVYTKLRRASARRSLAEAERKKHVARPERSSLHKRGRYPGC